MTLAMLLLHGLTHACIGVLPRVFFRRGRLNLMWWLTAAPFIANGPFMLLAYLGLLPTVVAPVSTIGVIMAVISVPFGVAAVALLFFTFGTHRIPIALWHQADDSPQHIVTWGAYAHIRHPFYASFILALIGAFLYSPSLGTAVSLAFGIVQLNRTASREEGRLAASDFGAEYRDYLQRTGRFWPRFGRRSA